MTRIGSTCSGYGGLDAAVREVIGGELAWVADNDPGAAAILAHRFPSVPNLGDMTTVDWSAVEPVDVLATGFPCQPVSAAGQRKGLSDERWLFDDICTAVGRMVARPRLLVLENVPGLLSANGGDAMARVVQGLAALGYEFTYRLVRASDAGAPHKRERWFCLAWLAEDADGAARGERRLSAPGQAEGGRARADAGGPGGARAAADARGEGRQGPGHAGAARGQVAAGNAAADAERDGREGRQRDRRAAEDREAAADRGHGPSGGGGAAGWGPYGPAIARWERVLGRPAPRPTEPGKTGERLSPRFAEFMMGLPEGWVTDVPGLSRNAKLKALGNGVVPRQAELALRLLLDRAGFTRQEAAA